MAAGWGRRGMEDADPGLWLLLELNSWTQEGSVSLRISRPRQREAGAHTYLFITSAV